MFKVSIVGTLNDGTDISEELIEVDNLSSAEELCTKLNKLLRDKLLCIFRDMLEWRFDISMYMGDGTYDLYEILDSDKDDFISSGI